MKKPNKILAICLTTLRHMITDGLKGEGSIRIFLAPSSADLKHAISRGEVAMITGDGKTATTDKMLSAGFVLICEFAQTNLEEEALEIYRKKVCMEAKSNFLKLLNNKCAVQ